MMAEASLTERFHKDPDDEAFLRRLNLHLAPLETATYKELDECLPTLHVVGVPRSGTTLATQLLASHLDVGYISNFIAAFWRAPVHGIRLSRKLLGQRGPSSFASEFGRTKGLTEPHEFGYFWRDLLAYDEPLEKDAKEEEAIDWARVRRVLLNVTEAFGRPVVFKTFHVSWHARRLHRELPRTCFLRIRREPIDSALSLLRMRREFLGSEERWASFRPAEYRWLKDRPFDEQVAGQVHYLERSIDRELSEIPRTNLLDVDYPDLCADPPGVLEAVRALLARNGGDVDVVGDAPGGFHQRSASSEDPYYERIVEALARFAAGPEVDAESSRAHAASTASVAGPALESGAR